METEHFLKFMYNTVATSRTVFYRAYRHTVEISMAKTLRILLFYLLYKGCLQQHSTLVMERSYLNY